MEAVETKATGLKTSLSVSQLWVSVLLTVGCQLGKRLRTLDQQLTYSSLSDRIVQVRVVGDVEEGWCLFELGC